MNYILIKLLKERKKSLFFREVNLSVVWYFKYALKYLVKRSRKRWQWVRKANAAKCGSLLNLGNEYREVHLYYSL